MKNAGFANYPLEWWHFSYGDRLWAAYTNQKEAVYDVLDDNAPQHDIDLCNPRRDTLPQVTNDKR